jgi:ABC-2 type transport system permease protein
MIEHPTHQPFPVQLLDMTLVQLANWRWSWRASLLTSVIAPVLSTAALGVFAAGRGPDVLAYILTGNLVMSLLFGTFDRVATHFAYMRMVGRLDYFATLPIYRATLILATVFAFLVLALPAFLITLIAGALFLDLHLALSPWLLVAIPLIGTALCGLGALIGIVVRSPEEVGSLSTLITFLLVGFGPVVIPPEHLPGIVLRLGYLSPATYAASALRQTVLGMADRIPLGVDLVVLAGFLAISLWLVGQRMDWRQA